VDGLGVEESVERLKAHPSFASPIAAALDDWWAVRLQNSKQSSGWTRLVAVARGIDADPVRDRLRASWERSPAEAPAELRGLADSINISAQHPATIVMLTDGLRRGNRSDSEVAVRILRAAQIVYPGDYWINFDLAYVLFEQTDWEGAIRFYTAAISIRPNSAVAHNNIGLAEKRHLNPHESLAGGREKAIGRFRRAIEIDSKFADAYMNLGAALSTWQEKWGEAEASYRKAIELDPTLAEAHVKLGELLMSRDQVAEAIVHFRAAIRLDPNDFGPQLRLGNAREIQGWPEAALARYRKASDIGSRSFEDHRLIADHLLHMRDLDRAIFHYRKAAEGLRDPMEKSAAYYHLGNAQVHKGLLDDAIESFRLCMKIGPKSQLPARLAQILANSPKRYDPASAQRIAEALIRFTPREEPHGLGLAWQALAWARYRLRDYAGAIVAIKRVKELGSPGDSYEWFLLALAHKQLGNRREAREWYEKAVEWMNKNAGHDYQLRLFRGEARELFGDPVEYEVAPPPRCSVESFRPVVGSNVT
jgi:tetratricopeptide (TPR) repeat protein